MDNPERRGGERDRTRGRKRRVAFEKCGTREKGKGKGWCELCLGFGVKGGEHI